MSMAGSGYDVEPASLRRAEQGVRSAGERLANAWQALIGQAQGMGDIFGDDMVGGLIGASYAAAQDIANRSYGSVVKGFGGFADGLATMAERYDRTEQVNVAAFTDLNR